MPQAGEPMLKVEGLVKAYGPVRAVDGVSFSVNAETIVALVGPNGAGKTTTLKCILGVTGFEGTVEVDGLSVRRQGKEVRRRIGYLPQLLALNDRDTCWQALEFLAGLKGADRRRLRPLLRMVNLDDQRGTRVGHLSGGRRQFHELLLRLRGQGTSVLLSTHFMDHLGQLADRVIVLQRGRKAFDGTIEELARRAPGNRYIVNLNGTACTAFMEALKSAGIGPERVQPADPPWEDMLLASPPTGEGKPDKEQR